MEAQDGGWLVAKSMMHTNRRLGAADQSLCTHTAKGKSPHAAS
jgi:hypothetical protein